MARVKLSGDQAMLYNELLNAVLFGGRDMREEAPAVTGIGVEVGVFFGVAVNTRVGMLVGVSVEGAGADSVNVGDARTGVEGSEEGSGGLPQVDRKNKPMTEISFPGFIKPPSPLFRVYAFAAASASRNFSVARKYFR
jgi:hypothetical protein